MELENRLRNTEMNCRYLRMNWQKNICIKADNFKLGE